MNFKSLSTLIGCVLMVQTALASTVNRYLFSSYSDTINVGLIVSGNNNLSAKQAVMMATDLANQRDNGKKQYLNLIIRSADGPWGAGSNELVKLIHHDKVSAIIGSLDSRNAHLAEQISAKTQIVFLSTRAIDPSLSQAFVPWYFRCIPNAQQQANNLAKTIYKSKDGKVGIVLDSNCEESYILKYFKKEASLLNEPEPYIFELANYSQQNINELLKLVTSSGVKKLMFLTSPEKARLVHKRISSKNLKLVFYGTNALDDSDLINHIFYSTGNGITDSSSPVGKFFLNTFKQTYGYKPDTKAAYAYDGINLIIDAIRKAGSDREKIKDELIEICFTNGVTGTIIFDEKGNRVNE